MAEQTPIPAGALRLAACAIADAQSVENDGTPETYAAAALRTAAPILRAEGRTTAHEIEPAGIRGGGR